MPRLQRFLSLRKVAALFPLNTQLELVASAKVPSQVRSDLRLPEGAYCVQWSLCLEPSYANVTRGSSAQACNQKHLGVQSHEPFSSAQALSVVSPKEPALSEGSPLTSSLAQVSGALTDVSSQQDNLSTAHRGKALDAVEPAAVVGAGHAGRGDVAQVNAAQSSEGVAAGLETTNVAKVAHAAGAVKAVAAKVSEHPVSKSEALESILGWFRVDALDRPVYWSEDWLKDNPVFQFVLARLGGTEQAALQALLSILGADSQAQNPQKASIEGKCVQSQMVNSSAQVHGGQFKESENQRSGATKNVDATKNAKIDHAVKTDAAQALEKVESTSLQKVQASSACGVRESVKSSVLTGANGKVSTGAPCCADVGLSTDAGLVVDPEANFNIDAGISGYTGGVLEVKTTAQQASEYLAAVSRAMAWAESKSETQAQTKSEDKVKSESKAGLCAPQVAHGVGVGIGAEDYAVHSSDRDGAHSNAVAGLRVGSGVGVGANVEAGADFDTGSGISGYTGEVLEIEATAQQVSEYIAALSRAMAWAEDRSQAVTACEGQAKVNASVVAQGEANAYTHADTNAATDAESNAQTTSFAQFNGNACAASDGIHANTETLAWCQAGDKRKELAVGGSVNSGVWEECRPIQPQSVVLTWAQSPKLLLKQLKQAHIDPRLVCSSQMADEQILSLIVALADYGIEPLQTSVDVALQALSLEQDPTSQSVPSIKATPVVSSALTTSADQELVATQVQPNQDAPAPITQPDHKVQALSVVQGESQTQAASQVANQVAAQALESVPALQSAHALTKFTPYLKTPRNIVGGDQSKQSQQSLASKSAHNECEDDAKALGAHGSNGENLSKSHGKYDSTVGGTTLRITKSEGRGKLAPEEIAEEIFESAAASKFESRSVSKAWGKIEDHTESKDELAEKKVYGMTQRVCAKGASDADVESVKSLAGAKAPGDLANYERFAEFDAEFSTEPMERALELESCEAYASIASMKLHKLLEMLQVLHKDRHEREFSKSALKRECFKEHGSVGPAQPGLELHAVHDLSHPYEMHGQCELPGSRELCELHDVYGQSAGQETYGAKTQDEQGTYGSHDRPDGALEQVMAMESDAQTQVHRVWDDDFAWSDRALGDNHCSVLLSTMMGNVLKAEQALHGIEHILALHSEVPSLEETSETTLSSGLEVKESVSESGYHVERGVKAESKSASKVAPKAHDNTQVEAENKAEFKDKVKAEPAVQATFEVDSQSRGGSAYAKSGDQSQLRLNGGAAGNAASCKADQAVCFKESHDNQGIQDGHKTLWMTGDNLGSQAGIPSGARSASDADSASSSASTSTPAQAESGSGSTLQATLSSVASSASVGSAESEHLVKAVNLEHVLGSTSGSKAGDELEEQAEYNLIFSEGIYRPDPAFTPEQKAQTGQVSKNGKVGAVLLRRIQACLPPQSIQYPDLAVTDSLFKVQALQKEQAQGGAAGVVSAGSGVGAFSVGATSSADSLGAAAGKFDLVAPVVRQHHLQGEALAQAESFMRLALDQAKLAAALGEVPVGAVLVDEQGQVVAQGYNRTISDHDITAHAEMVAFRKAGQVLSNHRLTELTLYVTLEPCCMCGMAAIHARVKRIVYGAAEPKTGACGSQFNLVQDLRHNHQIEVFSGVLEPDCRQLLQDFFQSRRK